jgi:acetyl/propionyl-CoA carboxylase alpha subunit
MMFEITVGDRVRLVSVARQGALLHVTLDSRTHIVDARRLSDTALSLLVQNGHDAAAVRPIDVAFGEGGDVHLLGRVIAVEVRQGVSFGRQKKDRPGGHHAGPQRVTAPMPGKIVRLLVHPGDHVKAQQGLVVVEAMKMENELRAARDGRVREVSAVEGQSVEAGAVLMVVE